MRIGRWIVMAGMVVVSGGLAAACGGDDDSSAPTGLPSSRDDVLVRLGDGPIPDLLIAGDGAVYQRSDGVLQRGAGGRLTIAPAPAAPSPVAVSQLTVEGLQLVLERADELGLLDPPPEYADVDVTDSGSTSLVLRDGEGTYEHVAYALGYDDEEVDDERQALLDMVEDLRDLEGLVGDENLGRPQPYVPMTYAVSVQDGFTDEGQRWPSGLAVEEGCVDLPVARFPDGVAGTYLRGEGRDAELIWVAPDLPGDDC